MARYIDADALIKTVNGFTKFYHLDRLHVGTFIDAVVDMPTAEVREVVRGEWIVCDAKPPTWWYECSVCGSAGNINYHYCPNCWAEMKEKA